MNATAPTVTPRGHVFVVRGPENTCQYARTFPRKSEADADAKRHRWECHLSGGVSR